ncbi:hypothetical protein ACFB49_44420 [Sphingomonas sp. DBB INV C78]|uniref:hypothetical protein n=1 Tax=Sphingomonas sp. DBB INV C78 TaxID=3349434 RepID=UPI0036D2E034
MSSPRRSPPKTDPISRPDLIAAAGLALAEVATGLLLLVLGEHGRADLAPFVAVRPWLLLILMVALARWDARARLTAAVCGLIAASLDEWAWLGWHGGGELGPVLRALAAGLALVALGEVLIRLAGWIGGGWSRLLAGLLGAGLLLWPGLLPALDRMALGPAESPARKERPPLALLSGLPLAWSEAGVAGTFDARPPAIMALLARNYRVQPIAAGESDLPKPGGGLLLVAQPRIGPSGLVALDSWVRAGGRALILTDPDLRWPTRLPPDDPGHPPDATPLAPLLAHWGVALARDTGEPLAIRTVGQSGVEHHVRLGAPGTLSSDRCAVRGDGLVADCRIGNGRALILADADLLLDDLWVGVGLNGTGRFRRTADNGPFLITLLDDLRGKTAAQPGDRVLWIDSGGPDSGWLIALAPGFALLLLAFARRRRGMNAALVTDSSQTYPQAANRHKGGTMADFRHDDR